MVFLMFGGLYLGSVIAVSYLLPAAGNERIAVNFSYLSKQVKKIFAQKNFRLCYVITFMLLLTFIGMYTVLGDYLKSAPFNLTNRGMLYVRGMGIAGMIFSPFTGSIVKKHGLLQVVRLGLTISVVSLFVLGIGSNLAIIVFMSLLYVTGISLTFPAIMTLIGELSGNIRAIAASIYAFILFIGAAIGPIIAITLIEIGGYFVAFAVLSLLLLVGLMASFLIKK